MNKRIVIGLAVTLLGCEQETQSVAPLYDTAVVEPRMIEVGVEAAGVIEPVTTVEVKSKASGEILAVHADTGDVIESGTLLVEVDKRTPRNHLAEVEASLIAARARRTIAETAMERARKLHESGTLTESDLEQSELEFANAQAQVVSAEVAVENARISMEDTDVRAPITGTIIKKAVEPGMVIESPMNAVSGGTVLMQMADLNAVQVRTLVDETDIGKIKPGMSAEITVAAYPNQPFEGEVIKIEPLAIVEQNVTMFAVLVRIENRDGLLMPGMNSEVQIQIASREEVSAVPTAALRTDSDIPATAMMLGMPEDQLRRSIRGEGAQAQDAAGARNLLEIGGRTIELPDGADAERIAEIMARRRSGGELTAEEREMLRPLLQQLFADGALGGGDAPRGAFGQNGSGPFQGGGAGAFPGGAAGGVMRGRAGGFPDGLELGDAGASARENSTLEYQFGGDYWVIAIRDGSVTPVPVRTGLTDLAYSEIVSGLRNGDEVLLLPSASLFEQQAQLQEFISDRFSSTPFQQQSRPAFFRF